MKLVGVFFLHLQPSLTPMGMTMSESMLQEQSVRQCLSACSYSAISLRLLLGLMAVLAYLYAWSINSYRPLVSPLVTPANVHKTRKHQLPKPSAGRGELCGRRRRVFSKAQF